MGKDDWMKMTGPGKRESAYSSHEPVRQEKCSGNCKRESDYTAEKMDKGLPLRKRRSR